MGGAPFFIVGCVRSGATLLRDVLRLHPRLACPEETHFFRWAQPFGTEGYARSLIADPIFRKHREIDGISEPEFEAMLGTCTSRADLTRRYLRLFVKRRKPTATRWFEKTPQHVYGLFLIASEFPQAKFVHIVRDPLDVAASLRIGKIVKVASLVGACNYWNEAVAAISVLRKAFPFRVYEVRYEDFVRDVHRSLASLLAFLGEAYDPADFEGLAMRAVSHRTEGILTEAEIAEVERSCKVGRDRYRYPDSLAGNPPRTGSRDATADETPVAPVLAAAGSQPRLFAFSTGNTSDDDLPCSVLEEETNRLLEAGECGAALPSLLGRWKTGVDLKSVHPSVLAPLWHHFRGQPAQRRLLIAALDAGCQDCTDVPSQELERWLLFLELLLIDGAYHRATDIGGRLAVRYSRDLRLQDLRARASILEHRTVDISKDLRNGFAPFRGLWCRDPFEKFTATASGQVALCCTGWMNQPVGSYYETDFESVYSSPLAQDVRRSILDGSFQYCNKMTCSRLRSRTLPPVTGPLDKYSREIIANKWVAMPHVYPRHIVFSEDPACNLTCPSCRERPRRGNTERLRHFEKEIFPHLMKGYKTCVRFTGHGDPFASQHYLRLLRALDPSVHKIGTLILQSNGTLFSQEVWDRLANLHPYNPCMGVSIDAATEETYSAVRRGGNWRRLQEALALMKELRRAGKIRRLQFYYVVQNTNFREMPAFVEMAKRYGVDEVFFAHFHHVRHITNADYREQAVYLPSHPNHAEFKALLAAPIMKDPIAHYPEARVGG